MGILREGGWARALGVIFNTGLALQRLLRRPTAGMMQCMVTITHNDHVPELLAVIRRKPFAEPTETEMVEYLFTRVRTDRRKPDFENFAFEHVLSYQRRIAATKEHFMRRNKLTPLGIIQDWWEFRRIKVILVPAGLVFSAVTTPPSAG